MLNLHKTFNGMYKVVKVFEISSAKSYYNKDFSFFGRSNGIMQNYLLESTFENFFFICVLYFHVIKNIKSDVILLLGKLKFNYEHCTLQIRVGLCTKYTAILQVFSARLLFLLCLYNGMVILIKIVRSLV